MGILKLGVPGLQVSLDKNLSDAWFWFIMWIMGCEVLSFLHYSGGHMIASYYNVHLFLSSTALNILYPITPVKGAAPLSGSIKDSAISWKTKSSKKCACVHFCSPYFLAIKK